MDLEKMLDKIVALAGIKNAVISYPVNINFHQWAHSHSKNEVFKTKNLDKLQYFDSCEPAQTIFACDGSRDNIMEKIADLAGTKNAVISYSININFHQWAHSHSKYEVFKSKNLDKL